MIGISILMDRMTGTIILKILRASRSFAAGPYLVITDPKTCYFAGLVPPFLQLGVGALGGVAWARVGGLWCGGWWVGSSWLWWPGAVAHSAPWLFGSLRGGWGFSGG